MRDAPIGVCALRDLGNVVYINLNVTHPKITQLRVNIVDLIVRHFEEDPRPVVDVERIVRAVPRREWQR